MRIWLVGGGTAGHVTPLLALAAELKDQETWLVTDRHVSADVLPETNIRRIYTGKFRRYHGRSWLRRLVDLPTLILNLRDVILIMAGMVQSLVLSFRRRPDVVFLNGGAIGVPLSIVCRWRRIPYLVHESDVVMGLANRMAAPHAVKLLFGFDPGPSVRSHFTVPTSVVGIQLRAEFRRPPAAGPAKKALGLDDKSHMVLVTGGSQGARNLNRIVYQAIKGLSPAVTVIHIVGHGNGGEAQAAAQQLAPAVQAGYQISEYEPHRMMMLMAAADVVVTRAGATTLAELAQLGAATVIVPNPMLTGSHQTLNAKYFAEQGAAVVLSEADLLVTPTLLSQEITDLLADDTRRTGLQRSIRQLAKPDATVRIAADILAIGQGKTIV